MKDDDFHVSKEMVNAHQEILNLIPAMARSLARIEDILLPNDYNNHTGVLQEIKKHNERIIIIEEKLLTIEVGREAVEEHTKKKLVWWKVILDVAAVAAAMLTVYLTYVFNHKTK